MGTDGDDNEGFSRYGIFLQQWAVRQSWHHSWKIVLIISHPKDLGIMRSHWFGSEKKYDLAVNSEILPAEENSEIWMRFYDILYLSLYLHLLVCHIILLLWFPSPMNDTNIWKWSQYHYLYIQDNHLSILRKTLSVCSTLRIVDLSIGMLTTCIGILYW